MSPTVLKRKVRWREVTVFFALLLITGYLLLPTGKHWRRAQTRDSQPLPYLDFQWTARGEDIAASHEIDSLIADAFKQHRSSLSRATDNVADGAAAYRARRGRHPPPGFEAWYDKALKYDAVIVEEFLDQIYEDLEPFWSVEPRTLRNHIADWKHTLSVRHGRVLDVPQDRHRSRTWGQMLQRIASDLPDLDVMINPFDEPRVVAPWDVINSAYHLATERRARISTVPVAEFKQHIQANNREESQEIEIEYPSEGEVWDLFHGGCPLSESIDLEQRRSLSNSFVANWTSSRDLCLNQNLSNLHGGLINPATLSITTDLVPIFSAAKYSTNNDILLPAPSYYAEDALYSVKSWFGNPSSRFRWSDKVDGLVWRGKATGGKPNETEWPKFHRQRFVSMLNASEADYTIAELPGIGSHLDKDTSSSTRIAQWLSEKTDVAFTDLFCGPEDIDDPACHAMAKYYSLASEIPMHKQYRWKYLPDVDGNSLSGRFRAFLRSNSAPMKATIVKEWHDSRLTPWIHFIPVDISFRDLWAVMAYFLGFGSESGHDELGGNIAAAGQQWSERVLRREDMLLYMHRLLLEYARLCSDERDRLGYVADLMGNSG